MSRLLSLLSSASAPVARARLETLVEHDRNLVGHHDLLSVLREEISALIESHAVIDASHVRFAEVRGADASTLTVDIEVPLGVRPAGPRYCV